MKFYILTKGATMLLRVDSDISGEFFAKRGWQEDADSVETEMQARILNDRSSRPYNSVSIKRRFSDAIEVSEESFNSALDDLNHFNEKYDANVSEVNAMSLADLKTYILTSPSRMPSLVSYSDLNKLWQILYLSSDSSLLEVDEESRSDDEVLEDIRTLYSLLKDAESSNDNSVIRNLIRAAGDNVTSEVFGIDSSLQLVDEE